MESVRLLGQFYTASGKIIKASPLRRQYSKRKATSTSVTGAVGMTATGVKGEQCTIC
jgi:hypothetical protein